MNLGFSEIILLVVIGLLVFGPTRLPQMGKSIGEAIRGFKKGLDSVNDQASSKPVPHDEKKTPGDEGPGGTKPS